MLQLSKAVLGTCYRFVGKVKGAEADINLVIHQIGYLSTILRDLQTLTESNAQSDSLRAWPMATALLHYARAASRRSRPSYQTDQ